MTDTFGEALAILILVAAILVAFVGGSNCDADVRCESLKAQGVAAVITQGCVTRECMVIERVVAGEERAK